MSSASTATSSNTNTAPSMMNSISNMFGIKGGKSQKNRKSRSKKGKRSSYSLKKIRGGSCVGSTGAHGAQVAGEPGSQTAVTGQGNMMSYSAPSTLTPSAISGGKKKKKGGNLTEMAVPVVLVLGNKYGQYLAETFGKPVGKGVKLGKNAVEGVLKLPGNVLNRTMKSIKK
jgi:hypothetical protein